MSPPPADRRDRESMLDLPLRTGEGQAELPFGRDGLDVKSPPPPPPPPPSRRPKLRPSRNRLAMVGLGIVLGMVAAYLVFWPKPPEAQFPADPWVMTKVRLGSTGEPQDLIVTNVGERPMPITMVSLTGAEGGDFKIEEDACGAVQLEPTESCAIKLLFTPGAMGLRQAVLELHAEMPDSPAQVGITGEGTAPVLAVEPPTVRFGAHDVGARSGAGDLRVVNQGTASLVISRVAVGGSAERDFRVTGNECSKATLEPGESCAVRLMFVPRAAGSRHAEMVFSSDALEPVPKVELEGEGIWTGAAFDVQPRALDFGRHLVGTDRSRKSVQLINRQGTSLSNIRVGLAKESSGFSLGKQDCTGRSLAPGESCRVEVAFGAPEDGEFRSLLQISQGKTGTLGIDIQGQGVAPRWVLDAESLDFGDLRVGGDIGEALASTLGNDGSAGARITKVEVAGADAGAFKVGGQSCGGKSVQPGSSCGVSLTFQPEREGEHQAELLFHVEAGTGPQKVALVARAVAPRLGLDQEMVDFDRVRRTTMGQVDLTVANRGTAPLKLGPFSIAGDGSGSFRVNGGSCLGSSSLAPGTRCTINVAYSPMTEGRSTAQLEIQHDGISGPRSVPLAGIGLPPPMPRIVIEEPALDFGPQPVGNRSFILTVNVGAGGTGKLEFEEFVLAGAHPGDFRIVPATCHAAPFLQPGTSCAVGIRFTPTVAGARSAELVIRHNADPGTSKIRLVGEGLGPPPG